MDSGERLGHIGHHREENMIRKQWLAGLVLSGLAALGHAQTQGIEGVLEVGPTYSALFTTGGESGDLVGYAFKTQSPTGRTILQKCAPGLFCKVPKGSARLMNDTSALKFKDSPSGWYEITAARDAGMEAVTFGYEKAVKTRFGVISVRPDDNLLLFKGKPIAPAIEGNNGLSIVANYEMGKQDVVLVQNDGGSACPALFRFLTITASGVRVGPEFGTCTDIIYPTLDDKGGVNVAMPDFSGPFEPASKQPPARLSTKVFRYLGGQLFENGKVVR